MSIIIKVENLGKSYIIDHEQREHYTTLRDVIAQSAKKIFSFPTSLKTRRLKTAQEEFWALKDINFEIAQGDRVGIIGRNGAGKSTLLKILSRITEPTTGRATIKGRVASLLEVGTGFHPELTGRENIFLNGAILGMSRAEIKKKFDEIVNFAEVEKFLDTPVKRYSSGMYVRLAFAVAAHLEPEILIVDEVLAVGDAEFQKKCLGKMEDVSKNEGRTVLFVSHNVGGIKSICNSGMYLINGTTDGIDNLDACINKYLTTTTNRNIPQIKLVGKYATCSFSKFRDTIYSLNDLTINLLLEIQESFQLNNIAILIYNNLGQRMAILDFRSLVYNNNMEQGQIINFTTKIVKLPLIEGDYSLGLYMTTPNEHFNVLDIEHFTVLPPKIIQSTPFIPYDVKYRGVVELNHISKINIL